MILHVHLFVASWNSISNKTYKKKAQHTAWTTHDMSPETCRNLVSSQLVLRLKWDYFWNHSLSHQSKSLIVPSKSLFVPSNMTKFHKMSPWVSPFPWEIYDGRRGTKIHGKELVTRVMPPHLTRLQGLRIPMWGRWGTSPMGVPIMGITLVCI